MTADRMTKLAIELMRLGVSQSGVRELLSVNPLDEIERQLAYLPYRKAKRPEAFIIEAVRNSYSPPKEFYYAARETDLPVSDDPLDQAAEHGGRTADAEPQGHGTPGALGAASSDGRMEQAEPLGHPQVPVTASEDWPAE